MSHRILAVDDEESILRIIKVNLERVGYTVDTAHNGTSALTLLLRNSYDLVVSDIMMPEMDGLELLEHIRQSPDMADLPVILLTAKSAATDVTRGYAKGTDLYLTKPFNPSELVVWVKRAIFGIAPD